MKMKRNIMAAVLAGLLAFTTGCLSSAYHIGGENEYPYNGTADSFTYCLGVWWHEPDGEVENAMDAYTKMVYLFWIVDFPLEIASDTLWLPVDGTVELIGD